MPYKEIMETHMGAATDPLSEIVRTLVTDGAQEKKEVACRVPLLVV